MCAPVKYIVGRQPIFDYDLAVRGYELLFRDGATAHQGDDAMTAAVLLRVQDIGLGRLVGDLPVFVNVTRAFLVGGQQVPLPPDQTVLEIPSDVERSVDVVSGCEHLVRRGYRLALDLAPAGRPGGRVQPENVNDRSDHQRREAVDMAKLPLGGPGVGDDPLLEFASFVKFDVSNDDLNSAGPLVYPQHVTLVAKKLETHRQMAACRALGFGLFQGYLLAEPELLAGSALAPRQVSCLLLLRELCSPDTAVSDVQRVVESDPALSYRFLRMAGAGASRGLRRKVRSVREGVVLVGRHKLRSWTMLMLLADAGAGNSDQLKVAMVRARMCELMAEAVSEDLGAPGFTVGLVSALDGLLGVPLGVVVSELSLDDVLVDALLAHSGVLGSILVDAMNWEAGAEPLVLCGGLDAEQVQSSYLSALGWAEECARAVVW